MSPHLILQRVRHVVFTDNRKIKAKYCEGLQWCNVLRKHAESVVITYALFKWAKNEEEF
jgi:hypothetical protein